MIVNFPNYVKNPWLSKLVKPEAPMNVKVVNELIPQCCEFFHVSWEDKVIKSCKNEKQASLAVREVEKFLISQSQKSKIVWTIHNLRGHQRKYLLEEKKIRGLLFEFSNLIFIMSAKHYFIIPDMYHHKVRVVPHYLEKNPNINIKRHRYPVIFRYGESRNETSISNYLDLLNNPDIGKYVSDPRIKSEFKLKSGFITNRYLTPSEANLCAQKANFAFFYRKPSLNSGAFNFYLSNKLIIFHNSETVKYFDYPKLFENFCLKADDIKFDSFHTYLEIMRQHERELSEFIEARSPKKISRLFWSFLSNL